MTTERIDIQVDDSQLNELIKTLQSLTSKLDKVSQESKNTSRNIDKITKSMKEADTSASKLGRVVSGLRSGFDTAMHGISGFGASLEILKKGIEALNKVFDVLYDTVEVAAETSQEAKEKFDVFTISVQSLKTAVGLAVLETRAWRDIQLLLDSALSDTESIAETLKATADELWQVLKDLGVTIKDLAQATLPNFTSQVTLANGTVVDLKNNLEGEFNLNPMKQALLDVATVAFQVAQALDDVSVSTQSLLLVGQLSSLGLAAVGTAFQNQTILDQIELVGTQLDNLVTDAVSRQNSRTNAIAELVRSLSRPSGSGSGLNPDMIFSTTEGYMADRDAPPSSSSSSSAALTRPPETFNWFNSEAENFTEGAREQLQLIGNNWFNFSQDVIETFHNLGSSISEEIETSRTQVRERNERAQQDALAEEQRIKNIQSNAVNAAFTFGTSAADAFMSRSETLGLDIGEAFSKEGFSLLSSELPDLLGVAGPWGKALSGGISLIGSVVSGLFGRERKRREREARAAVPQQFNSSSNYITTNNVGMIIGDRRAVTQQLSNFNRDTQRRTG